MSGWELSDDGLHPIRRVRPANCAKVDAFYLEEIPETSDGVQMGVVLWEKGREMYLMNKKEGWGLSDYFEFRDKRLQDVGEPPRKNLLA